MLARPLNGPLAVHPWLAPAEGGWGRTRPRAAIPTRRRAAVRLPRLDKLNPKDLLH